MKTMIIKFMLRCEAYGHAVDEYLAVKRGDYQFASDAMVRRLRCQRQLELMMSNVR